VREDYYITAAGAVSNFLEISVGYKAGGIGMLLYLPPAHQPPDCGLPDFLFMLASEFDNLKRIRFVIVVVLMR
jgi:hypothetical protein